MNPLVQLIGDQDDFASAQWGRRPSRLATEPALCDLFSVDDVDQIVATAIRVPAIRLVREKNRVDPGRFCTTIRLGATPVTDVADPHKVLDEYRRGATVILQSLHRTWAPLSVWCAQLETELGWPVQCNAYLTPPATPGLDRHADGHDVFVVQTFGSKGWWINGLGDLTMRAGDVVYLPAGVEHVAGTVEQPSLHLTVGVHRPSARRIARRALAEIDLEAPPAPLDHDDGAGPYAAALRAASEALTEVDAGRLGHRLRRPPRRHLGGLLAESVRRWPLDNDSRVRVTTTELRIDRAGDRLRCSWPGGELSMPADVEPAIRQLAASAGDWVPVSDLEGLSARSQLVLARRLADEGLVRTDQDC